MPPPMLRTKRVTAAAAFGLALMGAATCTPLLDIDGFKYIDLADGGGGAGTSSGSGAGGSTTSSGVGGIGGDWACHSTFPPDGAGGCPAVCNAGCDSDTCAIDCVDDQVCYGAALACPPGKHCSVQCSGAAACLGAMIRCPDGLACKVSCDGAEGCSYLAMGCRAAVCSIDCRSGVDVCTGASVACGPKACTATCGDAVMQPEQPNMVGCDNSCDCTTCDGAGGGA